ncbi:hypothetical protein [Thalassobius sp. MITS945101]|uniref:hypothetical protein n=1 Tax=Thalassobius sp. MITS945101 TaxID=3096994 RepID=UPI00399A555E
MRRRLCWLSPVRGQGANGRIWERSGKTWGIWEIMESAGVWAEIGTGVIGKRITFALQNANFYGIFPFVPLNLAQVSPFPTVWVKKSGKKWDKIWAARFVYI